jgi:hypothetical protein
MKQFTQYKICKNNIKIKVLKGDGLKGLPQANMRYSSTQNRTFWEELITHFPSYYMDCMGLTDAVTLLWSH